MRPEDLIVVRNTFPYMYDPSTAVGSGLVPRIQFVEFDPEKPVVIEGLEFLPLVVDHGIDYTALGFMFGRVVYISDCNAIPQSTMDSITKEPLDIFILDALYETQHFSSHLSLSQCIHFMERLKPKKGYAIGMIIGSLE